MAIMDRRALTHLGVRVDGVVRPLCRQWRSSWNWTLVRAEVTCRECQATLAAPEGGDGEAPSRSTDGLARPTAAGCGATTDRVQPR